MDKNNDFGNAPFDMRICPKCVTGDMSHGKLVLPPPNEVKDYQNWISTARCELCGHQWYVCRHCTHVRKMLDTPKKVYKHVNRNHPKELTILNETRNIGDDDNSEDGNTGVVEEETTESAAATKKRRRKKRKRNEPDDSLFQLARHNLESLPQANSAPTGLPQEGGNGHDIESDIEETPSRRFGGVPTVIHNCQFTRVQSTDYYANNYHERHGVAFLVSRAFYGDRKAPHKMAKDDVQTCLNLSLLVRTLSVEQSQLLGDFLSLLFRRVDEIEQQNRDQKDKLAELSCRYYCPNCSCRRCRKGGSKEDLEEPKYIPVLIPPVPRNYGEIRSKIRDGKTAIMSILPHPEVHTLDDGHAYVLPSECIKHFLANGNLPMEFDKVLPRYPYSNFNETPRGAEIARSLSTVTGRKANRKHYNMSFLEWKDDCESAKSNKASKNSLWLFTVTIFLKMRGLDSPIGTYPVAIGPKGKNHDVVEKVIGDDICRMRTTATEAVLGWNGTNRPVPCTFSADLYMSLGDQPERRGGNCLQLGSSRHHARWRHACDYHQLSNVLPACSACFELMLECDSEDERNNSYAERGRWKLRNCETCTNWTKDFTSEMVRFERSKRFPKKYVLGGEKGTGKLTPIVLSYIILERVVNLTFRKVSTGKWTKVTGMAHMCDNCFNEKYASIVVTRALNVLRLDNSRGDENEYRELLKHKRDHPEEYLPVDIPALYSRGVPLHVFVDTPMHLILLGMARTVFRKLAMWAGRRGRKSTFLDHARPLLEQLDDLKLQWLIFFPKTFSERWGGWVSKHYGSLLRVALWIYGELVTIDDAPPYTDPSTDPLKWNLPAYQSWLKARGLPFKGKRDELKSRVMDYILGDPLQIPPIKPNPYGSAADLLEMVKSMVVLVTTLFQEKVERHTKDIIDLRVRIFLTRFDRFEKPMRSDDAKPAWLSSYNFLCLQNLPESVNEFGPARRWFEGKWLGERYVSAVKDERGRCPPKNVHAILMRNLHRDKSVEMLKGERESLIEKSSGTDCKENELLATNTRIYGSTDDLENQYERRLPLPVVVTEDGLVGCLFYEIGRNVGKVISIQLLEKSELTSGSLHYGLRYWCYKMTETRKPLQEIRISDYGVLLPKIGCGDQGTYTIITKNWSTEMFGCYDFTRESEHYGEENQGDGSDTDNPLHRLLAAASGYI